MRGKHRRYRGKHTKKKGSKATDHRKLDARYKRLKNRPHHTNRRKA